MADTNELISFIASMTGEGNLRVEENLGEGFVRLRVSEAERRQAKHDIQHVEDVVIEMLRNARDAGASAIYLAMAKVDNLRTLIFIDNGCGVPEDMREAIFEARVTSKLESMHMDRWGVHGRGMALFSIKQNCREAFVLDSGKDLGSIFKVIADTDELAERADQSTWPATARNEEGVLSCVRGPHNIIRAVCEFALEERHSCDVYLGSPTEIATTLFAHANHELDASRLLFLDDEKGLPFVDRLGFASDAADFIRIAHDMGIDISERTAHRILSGTLEPLRSVASRLLRERRTPAQPTVVDLERDRRGLKISRSDTEAFSRLLEKDFSYLSDRYYLSLASEPRVRVSGDQITVTFTVSKDE